MAGMQSLAFDEYGRPFIIVREQGRKERVHGIAAQKEHILAARLVTDMVRTSLGPRGELRIEKAVK